MNDSKCWSEVRNIGIGGGLHPNIHESGKGAQEYSFITNNTNFAEIVENAETAKKLLRNSL